MSALPKHSDALTAQQQADCLATVGDWDTHCASVLANIAEQAAATRLNTAVGSLSKQSLAVQAQAIAAIEAVVAAAQPA